MKPAPAGVSVCADAEAAASSASAAAATRTRARRKPGRIPSSSPENPLSRPTQNGSHYDPVAPRNTRPGGTLATTAGGSRFADTLHAVEKKGDEHQRAAADRREEGVLPIAFWGHLPEQHDADQECYVPAVWY